MLEGTNLCIGTAVHFNENVYVQFILQVATDDLCLGDDMSHDAPVGL
jgi:hypothetical protein